MLSSLGWSGTHHVDKTGLKLGEIHMPLAPERWITRVSYQAFCFKAHVAKTELKFFYVAKALLELLLLMPLLHTCQDYRHILWC